MITMMAMVLIIIMVVRLVRLGADVPVHGIVNVGGECFFELADSCISSMS